MWISRQFQDILHRTCHRVAAAVRLLGGSCLGMAVVLPLLFVAMGSRSRISAQHPVTRQDSVTHQDPLTWNGPRALALAARAIARRASANRAPVAGAAVNAARAAQAAPAADSVLRNFTARANGYVYFYLDREDTGEKTLVKTDQIALEIAWRAPDQVKQTIVGMRDENRLPNRMHYHLDHLTVVLDEFGDVIRMGEGDEVRAVPHPAAPGADSIYDYRLADSLTIRWPGVPDPIRVYRLEVRPERFGRPAIIGSLYIDRATAEVVRMAFTFTPASYVDPRLDYIRVSLDNGLWNGRYWLPHEQRIEIRRQVSWLDFPAGGVIRGTFRLTDYRINQPIPDHAFRGPRVVAAPRGQLERYAFNRGIYDGLAAEGLAKPSSLAGIRAQATTVLRNRYLSGLPRLRLHLPGASSVVRYNRAEGLFLGAGAAYALTGGGSLSARAGYAFGAARPVVTVELSRPVGHHFTFRARAYRNRMRDLGAVPGAAGLVNSLFGALAGRDFLDPYYVRGASVRLEYDLRERWSTSLRATAERHRSASLTTETAAIQTGRFERPILPVTEGTLLTAEISLTRSSSGNARTDWSGRARIQAGSFDGEPFARPRVEISVTRYTGDRTIGVRLDGATGVSFGSPPIQHLFLIGGRLTLPGYPYRGFAGDRFALLRAEASRVLLDPWIRLRLIAAAGWTSFSDGASIPGVWDVQSTSGIRTSVGAGLGLVHGILRVDAARGLRPGGDWQVVLSVRQDLRDML